MKKWLLIVVIGALVIFNYGRSTSEPVAKGADIEMSAPAYVEGPERPDPPPAAAFRCDGRTRCPEMRSCQEAEYFLSKCPEVLMDGDHDGVPCEDQHCRHKR